MHLIIYQNQNLQDVHPSSSAAIDLLVFGFRHLATTLAIHWGSWRLITKRGGQLHSTGFSTSLPAVVPKGGKPHALTSGQSADRLDNLSYICISEWEYTFQVTYVLRWQQRLSTQTGGGVNMMEQSFAQKGKCRSQYQNSSRYLSHDFNPEDLSIGRLHVQQGLKVTILHYGFCYLFLRLISLIWLLFWSNFVCCFYYW